MITEKMEEETNKKRKKLTEIDMYHVFNEYDLDELHDESDAEADVGADVVDVPHGEVPLEEPPLLQLFRVLQLPQEIC